MGLVDRRPVVCPTLAMKFWVPLHYLPTSAKVKTEMKGMRREWSAQRTRRVSICAVLAMHVPKAGIHTLCRFPCVPIHPFPLFTGKKRECLLVFVLL